MPSDKTIRELDKEHVVHAFTPHSALSTETGLPIFTRGDGVYLWDTENKRYIDSIAGLFCVTVGYGRQELADAAAQQMRQLAYCSAWFGGISSVAVELATKLSELTRGRLPRVLFASSGSEATDSSIWVARRYWDTLGKPRKFNVIACKNAYHGSTMMALSLTEFGGSHNLPGLPLPGISHIKYPRWFDDGTGTPEQFGIQAAKALEDRILELGPENVAAFIAEPIQGGGGGIVPPKTYWPEIQRICRRYDVLLIADEVITGFGRTGNWFAFDTFGFLPDIITIAKGLTSGYVPMSAVMFTDRVGEVVLEKGEFHSHGFTYAGHPVAAAVALRNIEIMERENMVRNVRDELGPYLANRLRKLEGMPMVGEVRSCGLLAAIDLFQDPEQRRRFEPLGTAAGGVQKHALTHGVAVLPLDDTVMISPPLSITRNQIDAMVDGLQRALDSTARELRVDGHRYSNGHSNGHSNGNGHGHGHVEVELSGGRRLRVPVTFDRDSLRKLLDVLE